MITFLNGIVVEKQPTRVVLDVGGVGYEAFIPLSTYDRLPAEQAACRLLVYDHVREDVHALYGFLSEPERKMFLMLLSTTGIGPKLALSILSGLSTRDLGAAISAGDVGRLSMIPGIGKKTAERIVVELRDKMAALGETDGEAGDRGLPGEKMHVKDAILALVSLGYRQAEAAKMVRTALEADESLDTVESIIRKVLAR